MLELGAFEQRLLIAAAGFFFSVSAIWLEQRQIMPGHLLLLPIIDLASSYAHILDLY